MTGRSAGNALTKTTAILAATFFATSLALSILARPAWAHRPSILNPAGRAGRLGSAFRPRTPVRHPRPGAPAAPQAPQSK